MGEIKGKVIWITGASSGIGEALAYQLVEEEAKVILSARREEELERVKKTCGEAAKSRIKLLPFDLAQPDTLSNQVNKALQLFGRIDILINNGGISQRSLAKDTLVEVDRRIMEVNYFSAVALTKLLLPSLISQKSGHIVNVSSLVGKFSTPYRSGYAASKHALHGFFDALRAELWKDGIKVTMICPGFVQTNISFNALTGKGEKHDEMDQTQANGISPESCARSIIRAIKRDKEEIYIGGREKYAVFLKRFFPGLFSRIVRKARVR